MKARTKTLLGVFLLLVMPLALLGGGGWWLRGSILLVQRGKRTRATCTRIERRRSGQSTRYTFYVTFETEHGTESDVVIEPPFTRLREGDEIDILYDPENPRLAQAANFISLWACPGFLVLAGVVYLVFWAVFVLRWRRRVSRE